ncbi:Ku protein [Rhodoplanes sp. SY1]|uniref:non-homologous end joining protein Ku n=1 Tax=Rhodoplanes sp. SY1 TaxID=3166646 RepID=UPI0038B4C3A2
MYIQLARCAPASIPQAAPSRARSRARDEKAFTAHMFEITSTRPPETSLASAAYPHLPGARCAGRHGETLSHHCRLLEAHCRPPRASSCSISSGAGEAKDASGSTRSIEIDAFVPRDEIDTRFLDAPYFVVPNDKVGQEAFAVIREAMRGKGMVALGRVVLARRERVLALEAFGKGLRGTLLRYPYEVRSEEPYFDEIPEISIPTEMLTLAEHILDSKTTGFDPAHFNDRHEEALVELLRKKQAGLPAEAPAPERSPATVINLMDALKRSIAAEEGSRTAPAPSKSRRSKKAAKPSSGQREMFLPIPGKRTGKAAAEEPARPRTRGRKTG